MQRQFQIRGKPVGNRALSSSGIKGFWESCLRAYVSLTLAFVAVLACQQFPQKMPFSTIISLLITGQYNNYVVGGVFAIIEEVLHVVLAEGPGGRQCNIPSSFTKLRVC